MKLTLSDILAGVALLLALPVWGAAPNLQHHLIVPGHALYSPSFQDGVLCWGGFGEEGDLHDTIYCADVQDPFFPIFGWNMWVALNPVSTGMNLINDMNLVIRQDGVWLGYTTCVGAGLNGFVLENNKVCVSLSTDRARTWTKPVILVDGAWLPGATRGPDGHVWLFTNGTDFGEQTRRDCGPDGVTCGPPVSVFTPFFYYNMEVRWNADLGLYEMVAETFEGTDTDPDASAIDYLTSADGLIWGVGQEDLVRQPEPGWAITPAFSPDPHMLYVGESVDGKTTGVSAVVLPDVAPVALPVWW